MGMDSNGRPPLGAYGFVCHGLTASAELGLLGPDDVLSTQEPLPGSWFRDEVRAFFESLVLERRPVGKPGAVSAEELEAALRELGSSDTCVLTAQTLLAEYTKWRDWPGGFEAYGHEWPLPAYMSEASQRRRAPQDPTRYAGTLLRFISSGSISGFIFKRLQRTRRVNIVLRLGLAALVDFLEVPLSTRDGVPRYGLMLISRPGHVQVIECRAGRCCIMQSSTNSYHLANFLLQVRPLTRLMREDSFFEVFERCAGTYGQDMPCEELLEHFRALLPARGDSEDDRVRRLDGLALLGGEPWSKVGLRPEEYLDFYEELLSFAPFHVAWPAPQNLPCVAY